MAIKKNYKKILVKFLKHNKKISFVFADLEAKKLPQTLDDADAIIFFPRKLISNNFLKKAKKLKWIHVGGAGIEHFMYLGLEKYKIVLTNGKNNTRPRGSRSCYRTFIGNYQKYTFLC